MKQNIESVKKYMTENPITFKPDQDIYEVVKVMIAKKISGGPVLNDKKELVGMISEKDCLRVLVDSAYYDLPAGTVADYMSKTPVVLSDQKNIVEVASEFLKTHFKRFPVVDKDGKLVGQISRSDVMRAVKDFKGITWDVNFEEQAKQEKVVIKPNFKDSR